MHIAKVVCSMYHNWRAERAHLVVQLAQNLCTCMCMTMHFGPVDCPCTTCKRNQPCLFHSPTMHTIFTSIYRQGRALAGSCLSVYMYMKKQSLQRPIQCNYTFLGYSRLLSRLSGLQSSSSIQFSPHRAHDSYISHKSLCTHVCIQVVKYIPQ